MTALLPARIFFLLSSRRNDNPRDNEKTLFAVELLTPPLSFGVTVRQQSRSVFQQRGSIALCKLIAGLQARARSARRIVQTLVRIMREYVYTLQPLVRPRERPRCPSLSAKISECAFSSRCEKKARRSATKRNATKDVRKDERSSRERGERILRRARRSN